MTPELFWMALTALMTGLFFAPYIMSFIAERGLVGALTKREGDEVGAAGWAQRAQWAHRNAVENFVIFAPLALGVAVTGTGTALTALAAAAYFWLRLGHFIVYTAGVPVVRTLLFAGGVVCQIILALAILTGQGAVE